MELVHISTTNTKLGTSIPTVNLPPILTCRSDAPCKKDCYACKGRFHFPSVIKSLQNNLNTFLNDPAVFFGVIDLHLQAVPYKYFRWFSAGDIVNERFFDGMVEIAIKHPDTKFLCFTKRYEIVNRYLDVTDELPANLIVVFSNWGDFRCENPYNLPTSWVELKKVECEIPEDARVCNGYCGTCVNTGCSCWDLKTGESVRFKQH